MATRLGDMAVGSTVKIKVNGTLTDFDRAAGQAIQHL